MGHVRGLPPASHDCGLDRVPPRSTTGAGPVEAGKRIRNRNYVNLAYRVENMVTLSIFFYSPLSLPEWTEEELEDMGDNFKKDIKKDRHLKEKLIEKLNVLELVHLMEPTIEDVWEEILLKEMKQNG